VRFSLKQLARWVSSKGLCIRSRGGDFHESPGSRQWPDSPVPVQSQDPVEVFVTPSPPSDTIRLRLSIDPPPQVLQTNGCLCHLTPASPWRAEYSPVRALPSGRVLLRAHRRIATRSVTLLPAPAFPTHGYSSRLFGGISPPDSEGFSS
jgi:hypothetical protein